MSTLAQQEKNLFNATETMAQFYDEIESFLNILFGNMERAGFTVKTERLRSGTFTVKNLTRRLLAKATVLYIKDGGKYVDVLDVEDDEDEIIEDAKPGKDTDVTITRKTKIPFVSIHLFNPKVIPTSHTLSSPVLLMGALGNMKFIDRKTGEVSKQESHMINLSNLANINFMPTNHKGGVVGIGRWKPKNMKHFRMEGKLIRFETKRLLEINSQEKIKAIAESLIGYSK